MALPLYNKQFLTKVKSQEPIFNNANNYGVKIKNLSEISVPLEAKKYWRVVGVHHLTGAENMGNHHVYCDVLDEDGVRINGSRLVLTQGNVAPVFAVVDKPAQEAGTNFPMWASTRATVAVHHDLPSESVTGLRIDHADEEIGNTWGHHSFYIVFQITPIPPAVEEVTEIPKVDESNKDDNNDGPPLSLEETITLTGKPLIIPLNPDAGFYKIGKQQNLGERLSSEYDTEYQGRSYRAQIFEKGTVYAEVGDWGNIKVIPRTN
ncbi:MAG: hypothetical protein KDJ52_23085 [Anaerolineae bacterium]|nr:hypothetical protein [Anaerolineae bacterium]